MTVRYHGSALSDSRHVCAGRRVLVVGAGIAGLALVRALRGSGARIEVVERGPAPNEAGAGIFLPGNAVRGLRTLGLDHAVADNAVRIERQRVADHRGRVLYQLDTASLWPDRVPTLATRRATVHAALLDDLGDAEIRWDTSLTALATDGPEVEATFDDGVSGRYDLVVGADGVHSTVRRLVFGEAGLRASGVYAWRLTAPRRHAEPVWSVRLGQGASFLTIPVSEDLDYHYLDVAGDGLDTSLAEVAARFDPTVSELVDTAAVAHAGPIEEVQLTSWTHAHVLLVGDAAHATPPSMAQGAALAIEDALVLAHELAATPSILAAMREYERRRRPRVDRVQQQTRQRDHTRSMHPAARNVLLRTMGRRLFRANYRGLRAAP